MNPKLEAELQRVLRSALETIDRHQAIDEAALGRVLASRRGVCRTRFEDVLVELSAPFFLMLTDSDAITWIADQGRCELEEAMRIVEGWRRMAREECGVPDDQRIHVEVLPGMNFRDGVPRLGPCREPDAAYGIPPRQSFSDPPLPHCLLSWSGRPLKASAGFNVPGQRQVVTRFRTQARLSLRQTVSFGSAAEVATLLFAHRQSARSDPFQGSVIRTETCESDGSRLELCWLEGKLGWGFQIPDGDDRGYPDHAVFAVGALEAHPRPPPAS